MHHDRYWIPAACALLSAVLPIDAPAQSPTPLDGVRLTQRPGASIPLDAAFTDEAGKPVTLRDYFGSRPVILAPVFYRCPMLCTQVLNALLRTVGRLDFVAGKEFEIVVFTIDPRETPTLAAEKKLHYLHRGATAESRPGWHFLTGEESQIAALTDAIGYHFVYDRASDQYAHPAAVVVLTPDGQISRYMLGLDYQTSDLRLALLEAGKGAIGSVVDRVVLRCFRYDPQSGRYGFAVMSALRLGAGLTLLLLAAAIFLMVRRPRFLKNLRGILSGASQVQRRGAGRA